MVLDEQRASGLSVRAFCRNESRSEASFYAWKKELRKRDGIVSESSSEQPSLVPVSIVDSPSLRQRLVTESQQPQFLKAIFTELPYFRDGEAFCQADAGESVTSSELDHLLPDNWLAAHPDHKWTINETRRAERDRKNDS